MTALYPPRSPIHQRLLSKALDPAAGNDPHSFPPPPFTCDTGFFLSRLLFRSKPTGFSQKIQSDETHSLSTLIRVADLPLRAFPPQWPGALMALRRKTLEPRLFDLALRFPIFFSPTLSPSFFTLPHSPELVRLRANFCIEIHALPFKR